VKILPLQLEILEPNATHTIDGITFRQAAFVVASEDSEIAHLLRVNESVIVLSELVRSMFSSGRYLIFTSASGIADDGGWEGIYVTHICDEVIWTFEYDEVKYDWHFQISSYMATIENIKSQLKHLPKNFLLEPSQVVFPEEWAQLIDKD
jgi:hypothetical protein